jgi:hypothetical protein
MREEEKMQLPDEPAAEASSTDDIEATAKVFGVPIAPERLEGAGVRLQEMLDFLAELDALDLDQEPPAMTFDPSWEARELT